MRKILYVTLSVLLFTACGTGKIRNNRGGVYVSIAPIAYLVERIADTTITVGILVPETTSPETYEPTTLQIQKLSESRAYIHTGLIDFEKELAGSISELSDSMVILNLSEGVELITGSCSHGGDHAGHAHGTDPHVWLSPRLMRGFAEQIALTLTDLYPENGELYRANLVLLHHEIDSLDRYIGSKKLEKFAIAHPSLTYYARDYGVEQYAIEIEGKEPSIAQMKELVEQLKSQKVTKILTQKQTSDAAAVTIAREVGAQVVEFDPVAKEWLDNMYYITNQIAR